MTDTMNAAKYGALLNNGRISLSAERTKRNGQGTVVLTWNKSANQHFRIYASRLW